MTLTKTPPTERGRRTFAFLARPTPPRHSPRTASSSNRASSQRLYKMAKLPSDSKIESYVRQLLEKDVKANEGKQIT